MWASPEVTEFNCLSTLLMAYSTSNIGVTLKSWLGVVQGQSEWRRLMITGTYDLLLVCHYNYSSILHHFWIDAE